MLQLVLSAFYMCGPGCEQGNWPVRRKMLSKTYSSPHTARNILPIHNSTWSLRPATSTLADDGRSTQINRLNPELNPICYLLALLGAHHFLHVSRIRVKGKRFMRHLAKILRREYQCYRPSHYYNS